MAMPNEEEDAGEEEQVEGRKWFEAEKAKTGRASCKKCKDKIDTGTLRIAKLAPNPFGAGVMKNWHHPQCFFDSYLKARATTRRLRCPEEELEGWDALEDEDKEAIITLIGDQRVAPKETDEGPVAAPGRRPPPSNPDHKDHAFREFRRLCAEVSNTSAYLGKTAIIKNLLDKGTDGDGFKGDVYLWLRMLLPMAVKRVYNLHNKQLIKLFSKIFGCNMDDMLEHLEQGDVSETIREYFEESKKCPPAKKSKLTLQEVDEWLEDLSKLTKEEDQLHHLGLMAKKCTSNDLKIVIRLVVHDLKTSAGPKHVLEALHPDAYKVFQTSRDLDAVITKVLEGGDSVGVSSSPGKLKKAGTSLGVEIKLLTPVLPMLAEACRSVEYAMKKCPNGMISEIKYDGERVQVHKKGKDFKYFSRSLKPVLPHKVAHFKDYIPKAFSHGEDLILDSEILLIDTDNGKPLPFGTLGVHKKTAFKNASVCLFVFDCLYYNGKSLLDQPTVERRKFLTQNMKEIQNHVMFSEMQVVHQPKDLEAMISKVLRQGLEGLVLKDLMSSYEPGKRHWLKVKKDYLKDGAMADSADLVVLGAWFGSGAKGGMMSIFLMGCWDPKRHKFCTVTKVHGGHDDKTLERLQTELQMIKISKDRSRVPDWLVCTKTMVPDFVSKNPKESPVWEITGAEFTRHEVHTADGISVRFPRVSAIRSDKTWEEATSLPELQVLYEKSKEFSDFTGLGEENPEAVEEVKEEMEPNEDDDDEAQDSSLKIDEAPTEESEKKEKSHSSHKKKRKKRDDDYSEPEDDVHNKERKQSGDEDVKTKKRKADKDKKKSKHSEEKDGQESEEEHKTKRCLTKSDDGTLASDHSSLDEVAVKHSKKKSKREDSQESLDYVHESSENRSKHDSKVSTPENFSSDDVLESHKKSKKKKKKDKLLEEDSQESLDPVHESSENKSKRKGLKSENISSDDVSESHKWSKKRKKDKMLEEDSQESLDSLSEGAQQHEDKRESKALTPDNVSSDDVSESQKKSRKKKKKDKRQEEESPIEDTSTYEIKEEKGISLPKKPIPNIFKGIKLIVPPEEDKDHELERHFVAYGGIVLDESESELATHILHSKKSKENHQRKLKWSPNAQAVQLNWLLHSMKLKELQDIKKYLIKSHIHRPE